MNAPSQAHCPALGSETVRTADAQQPDRARQLPALSDGERHADAGVGARAQSNRETVDLIAPEAGLRQDPFNQAEGIHLAAPGGGGRGQHLPVARDRHAPLRG